MAALNHRRGWGGPPPCKLALHKEDGTKSEFEDKIIQIDPESHDHAFEEFQVKNEFKNDHAFEEFEVKNEFKDKKNSSTMVRKVEGQLNSSMMTMPSKSSKTKASSTMTMPSKSSKSKTSLIGSRNSFD